jgi:hypothetical protein
MDGETSISLVAVLAVPVPKNRQHRQDGRTQHLTHGDPQPLNLDVLHERLADRVGRIINEIGPLCHIPRLKLMTGGPPEGPNGTISPRLIPFGRLPCRHWHLYQPLWQPPLLQNGRFRN